MISVSGKNWTEKKINKNFVEKIKQEHNFSYILSQLIVSRNFTKEEIYSIKNDLELYNVFQNNFDFIQSVNLVLHAIRNNEKICILGDYDVDGSAATALFVRFFESINHPYFFYIPDREKDGYGATKKLIEQLILKKPKLIIMVDCGSTSIEAINYLNDKKIKSLVIDHHEINKPYPKANIIINPKKNNGYLKYDYLCATSLVYFFLDLLLKKIKCNINLRKFLIYVLLATVCDVMPLRKMNRLISITALKEFDINAHKVFIELFNLSKKKNKLNIDDLGYLIGPILNAGGRLQKSNYATELLSTNNYNILKQRSLELFHLNDKRKKIENIILNNIDFDKIRSDDDNIIIYYNPNINEGLIGIIASRLKEHFNKPSIVITNSNNVLKSSARSTHYYNIGKAVKNSLDQNIILSGGGHYMAAGFTLKKENLNRFKNFIKKDFLKMNISNDNLYQYDSEISSLGFNKDLLYEIRMIEPFGAGNPKPIFLLKDFKVIKYSILKKKHISCLLKSKIGFFIDAISFNCLNNKIGEHLLNYKKYFNVIAEINENFHNNKKTLQLIIKDLTL